MKKLILFLLGVLFGMSFWYILMYVYMTAGGRKRYYRLKGE